MELNNNRGTHYLSGGTADYVRPYVKPSAERRIGPHLPQRPLWFCKVCRDPWPCEPARLLYLMEYRQNMVALSIYMAGMLTDVIGDMTKLHPDKEPSSVELFDRFIAWTNPRRQRDQPT